MNDTDRWVLIGAILIVETFAMLLAAAFEAFHGNWWTVLGIAVVAAPNWWITLSYGKLVWASAENRALVAEWERPP